MGVWSGEPVKEGVGGRGDGYVRGRAGKEGVGG